MKESEYPYIEFVEEQKAALPESGFGGVRWITIDRSADFASHRDMQRVCESTSFYKSLGGLELNETNDDGLLHSISINPDLVHRFVRDFKPNNKENRALMEEVQNTPLPPIKKTHDLTTQDLQAANKRHEEAFGFGFLPKERTEKANAR